MHRFLRHTILTVTGALMVMPFVFMLSTALKKQEDIFAGILNFFPDSLGVIGNWEFLTNSIPIFLYMFNGLIVVAAVFVLQLIVVIPCAFALAKMRFKGSGLLFTIVLWSLLIPPQVTAIPIFIELYFVGLLNTYSALILPWIGSVFGIFLFRQHFKSIPDDLIHAARLDGLNTVSIILRIVLPMSRPVLIAFAIFSVVCHWNDFFWPLICLQDAQLYTPPLGITFFDGGDSGVEYGPMMLAACIVVAPLILAFLFAQKKFIQGVAIQAGIK